MHPKRKFSLSFLLLILIGLVTGEPALPSAHIICPENNSVYID